MAIFTGGKSKRVDSPRHLTLRHARRTVSLHGAASGLVAAPDVDAEPDLEPGQEKLSSFWAPGLEAGVKHRIRVSQTVTAPTSDKPLSLSAEQDFFVDAPQFSLPAGSVYSVYPPPGYADDCRILPHVVLSDPHLPWERLGSPKAEAAEDDRNKVPWLALLTFTQDELRLQPGALPGLEPKQTAALAVNMTVNSLWGIENVATPVTAALGEDVGASTGDFVFLRPDLFTSLFSAFDGGGNRVVPATPDTSQYKFLAHVRSVNTKGMAVGGVEDVGIFSVVVGSRCGPLLQTSPVAVAVHLVSIEGVEGMSFPGAGKDYVALCSLHSWTYTVQPPGMLDVADAFEHLGQTLGVLCPPRDLIEPLQSAGEVPARIASRLQDGYSLVKYRVQTGEQSVALYRGPFTPTVVDRLPQLSTCSNSGQDLQILDQEVGIVDITYAAAWNVGRALALGDQSFTAALVRLRTAIQCEALRESKLAAVQGAGTASSLRLRADVVRDLKTTAASLDQIHLTQRLGDGSGKFSPGPPAKRWYRPQLKASEYPALGFGAAPVTAGYLDKATAAARALAKATDGTVYNETNVPRSTDWQAVLAWVLDRMALHGVPAHYLIADPCHLGAESLRFFYIDPNWVDALVDGALSLGNHRGHDGDRVAIKLAVNDYIQHKPADQPHSPQIPTYGFYLRSDIVTMFPDLRVTVLPEPAAGLRPERAPLLRHEIVADGVMLGLLDRVPGSDELEGIVLTQPPHQQRFAVGRGLAPQLLEIDVLRQYTVAQADRQRDSQRHTALQQIRQRPGDADNCLVWGSGPASGDDLRLLRLPYFADQQLQILERGMGSFVNGTGQTTKFFDDDTATSALLAMQLNDPVYSLKVPLTGSSNGTAAAIDRLRPAAAAGGETASSVVKSLRTLQLLSPPKVQPAPCAAAEDGNRQPALVPVPRPAPAGSSPGFERHQLYNPAAHDLRHDLGPHVRAVINEPLGAALGSARPAAVSSGARPASARGTPEAPAGPPRFDCTLYSLSPGRTTWDSAIPDPQQLAQDLVFSVQVSNNNSEYNLVEFDISVPLGPVGAATSNFLLDDYDGPGASMLSNLRFNVLWSMIKSDTGKCLLLRLMPRSSSGWVNIRSVDELGFLLSLAKLNPYPGDMTPVTLSTAAYYSPDHIQVPIQGDFVVPIVKSTANV